MIDVISWSALINSSMFSPSKTISLYLSFRNDENNRTSLSKILVGEFVNLNWELINSFSHGPEYVLSLKMLGIKNFSESDLREMLQNQTITLLQTRNEEPAVACLAEVLLKHFRTSDSFELSVKTSSDQYW